MKEKVKRWRHREVRLKTTLELDILTGNTYTYTVRDPLSDREQYISILGKVLRGSVALTGLNLAGIRSQPHMSPHVHYARLKFRLQAYVILTI